MKKILVLEDDQKLNQGIRYALKNEGYQTIGAFTCQEGYQIVTQQNLDLIILDVNLPDESGYQFCKWVKEHRPTFVLFLSACDLESDVLNGYEYGGDDYVTKPFSINILLKKIAAIFAYQKPNKNIYQDDYLMIDFDLGKILVNNQVCSITPTEYRILKILIENQGQLLTYSLFLESLCQEGIQLFDKHALAVNINRLRKKIEDEKHTYIINVYGMGYVWK